MKSGSNNESDAKMKSESTSNSDEKMMSDSNTSDSEEKKDTVPELKSAEAVAKERGRGKRPIKVGKKTQTDVDQLTRKAKGLTLEVPKNVRPPVVKSSYALRSGSKGTDVMDMDVFPTKAAGQKRKGKEKKSDAEVVRGSVKADTEEGCKKFKKGRKHDDEPDKDGAGAAAGPQATRSSPRTRMVNPV